MSDLNIKDVFEEDELNLFLQGLAETVTKHSLSLDNISHCLPFMGELADNGFNVAGLMREFLVKSHAKGTGGID